MNHDSRRLGIPSRFRLFGTRSSVPTHSFGFALRENIDLGRELCLKLEPVLGPDPLYARVADAHLIGHSPHAPVRGGGRVIGECLPHHRADEFLARIVLMSADGHRVMAIMREPTYLGCLRGSSSAGSGF